MPKKIILKGYVQGVFCRQYCSQYGKKLRISGTATNLSDGSVRLLLNTDNEALIQSYIDSLMKNPEGYRFYGKISDISIEDYSAPMTGDYSF